ncbi:C45 family autoproteolytic acyltransferase/hydolase [Brenneria tiliae]|uniref:C45 family peptidase n=1 Tax=Brenneria tiliae TaxID=2914984 RepID=A0ABT0MXW6_9GAMM|nr:C45 family peptidase [Brenneria tiliae]MCL2894412.1 C45 family peptidase [Brenneria tiliae]
MNIITIAGDHYQIGYRLGVLGRRAYQEKVRATDLWKKIDALQQSPQALSMQQAVRRRFPACWRELEGLAAGLECTLSEAFAWNCRGDLLPSTSDGCSTVLGRTADGRLIIAHNEDGLPQLREECAMVNVQPDEGPAFTSFYYPGSICGHTFAVNARGLVITVNNIRALVRPIGYPRQILARAALDAATLDDAVAILTMENRSGAFHHGLAQCGDPRLISVETTGSGSVIREISAAYGHANHLIAAEMADIKQIITRSSACRQHRLNSWLGERADAPLDHDDALAVLSDRQNADFPIFRQDPADPDEENTLATAIFILSSHHVEWTIYNQNRRAAALRGQVIRQ